MSIRRKIGGTSGGRRSHGVTRIERTDHARRQRAMQHLERVRNRRDAASVPSLRIASVCLALSALAAGSWIGAGWALDAELKHVSVQGLRHLSIADVVTRRQRPWWEPKPGPSTPMAHPSIAFRANPLRACPRS